MQLKFICSLILLLAHGDAFANSNFYNKVSLRLGMVSHTFSQLESAFPGKDIESGSASILVIQGEYEKFTDINKSFFGGIVFSGIGGEVEKNYSVTGGMKYYFSRFGTKSKMVDDNLEIDMSPTFSYYAGWEVGASNVIYQTASAEVRGDLGVIFGGLGGVGYTVNDKSSYSAEFHFLKGAGVETDFLDVQVVFGITYFIEPLF
jgi:hypothetical protein